MSVGELATSRTDRPAYISFERRSVENKARSLREGRYVAEDIDFVSITPPYTKDVLIYKVTTWFTNLEAQVMSQRLPREWADRYKAQYEAWKKGQELPLDGTPVKGWGVISPAQQDTLISMKVLTVEDAAAMNDEGIRRFGMGGLDIRNKARAWIAQTNDKAPLTIKMAGLQQENDILKGSVETLQRQVSELMTALRVQQHPPVVERNPSQVIEAVDILPAVDDL